MSDNPRVSLYGAKYTVALANRHSLTPTRTVTVAGRHCEAGDEIARDVELPADIHAGDLLAVACTGAYHHSMASNYNMVARPPLVAVHRGRTYELVRRETLVQLRRQPVVGRTAARATNPDVPPCCTASDRPACLAGGVDHQHPDRLDADGHRIAG